MSFLEKLRIVGERVATPRAGVPGLPSAAATPVAPFSSLPRSSTPQSDIRVSNGLKEFLWNLDGIGHGTLLDLGPAWQTTISFFVERGFKVYAEDLLRAWKDFLAVEEERLRTVAAGAEPAEMTPEGRAERFLRTNLQYPSETFDAMLVWDLLDYLDAALVKRIVAHLADLLRPGGVVLAMFHSRKPEGFQRYRVTDTRTLQVLPAALLCPAQRTLQNREIQVLFSRFRTMKSFVSRDQLREVLFVK